MEELGKYTDSADRASWYFCSFHGETSCVVELKSEAEAGDKEMSEFAEVSTTRFAALLCIESHPIDPRLSWQIRGRFARIGSRYLCPAMRKKFAFRTVRMLF